MIFSKKMLCCAAGALLLSACASDGGLVRPERAGAVPLEQALAEADVAAVAGQGDKAQSILKAAATNYPTEKSPWLRMAQMKFDRASYGEAIVNAQEALQRDPADKLGNSIVAVSGLRLSTKALSDLSQQNNLNGSLRSEAQDLARLLRTSLGEDVLVPTSSANARKPVPVKKGVAAAAYVPGSVAPAGPAKTGTQANSTDPFGGLK